MRTLLYWGLALIAAVAGNVWGQDVKLYDSAPSVEELQKQLSDGGAAKKIRKRSIVFDNAAQTEQQPEGQKQPEEAAPPPNNYQKIAREKAPAAAMERQSSATNNDVAGEPADASAPVRRAIAFPINFRVNSAEILPESIPFIKSIAGLLNKDPSIRLLVEGHTDSSGNYARNKALSRDRAYSIVNYLIDYHQVDPSRLIPVGMGSQETLEGLSPTNPKNRRVQFRIAG